MGQKYFSLKNIVIISPEGWNHLFVSKHHYAIELSKCNKVFFLNPPSDKYSITESGYKNLWIIDYTPFVKGLRFFPKFLREYLMRRKFDRISQLAATRFDCVWTFDNSVFFDLGFLGKDVLKIAHIVDYSQNFQFQELASSADICFGVSQNIVERLKASNPRSFLVQHGISIPPNSATVWLPGNAAKRAMYAGNLNSRYLDKKLLYSIIESFRDIDFIFFGPGAEDWPKLSNTFFPGTVPQSKLLTYLEKADVLLLAFDVEKYPDQLTNSHKILDYLASGSVIVSTFISDYASHRQLIEMCDSKKDFPKLFESVVSDLSSYNSPERKKIRKEYAAKNTYQHRLAEIESLMRSIH
jgi:hypothetical protein